jgi:hypothetical protein
MWKIILEVFIYLFLSSMLFGCATDSTMTIYRNDKGEIVEIEQKQRFWKYLPGIGKSKSQAGEASSEVDSSALPDVDFTKED